MIRRKEVSMARFARRLLAACAVIALLLPGCAAMTRSPRSTVLLNYPHATEANMTQSPEEHYRYISDIAAHDARALVEDLDLLFMTDRPTRLTRWHSR
jgi:hypothetical protein